MALNPISFSSEILEQFRRYQLTAFPLADPRLAAQARHLLAGGLSSDSPLVQGPYVSLARGFAEGAAIEELAEAGTVHPALAGIAEHPALFGHQEDALRAALDGKHALISTGTGSGKTEAFLYPIVDRCLRLRDEGAPEGVTAVIVYPMNALAIDQRDRLRRLLAGTNISYGLYIGPTPRDPAAASVSRLSEGSSREAYEQALARRRKNDPDVVPWEECASRQEIRERKPRILMTNVSELELLLTRQADFGLFTDAPLSSIVLDEAHRYSGVSGAEVAVLMRRLRAFTGRSVEDVTCIATSATIVDPERGSEVGPEFLSRLCGVPVGDVVPVEERYRDLEFPGDRRIPAAPEDPQTAFDSALLALGAATSEAEVDWTALTVALRSLVSDAPDIGSAEELFEFLIALEPVRILTQELEHPRPLDEVARSLRRQLGRQEVEGPEAQAELLAYLALGAFAEQADVPLLRPKLHLFLRGLEGAVVTFGSVEPDPELHFSAAGAIEAEPARAPAAVLPVSVCRTCGQHYLTTHLHDFAIEDGGLTGGDAAGDSAFWLPATDGAAEEATRVRLTDWFMSEGDPDDEENRSERARERLNAHRLEVYLCRWCGAVHREPGAECLNPDCRRESELVPLFLVVEGTGFRCLGCNARSSRRGGRVVEPIRLLRATTVADVHILAQEMIGAAESDAERHLLMFADNRQDAAFQAGWMADHARRYRLRYLVMEAIGRLSEEGPVALGDVLDDIARGLESNRDLARAVAPEVFDIAANEAFGRGVGRELRRFLRIQLLREIALAYTQREGLERWGQLGVRYAGLTADRDEISSFAADLGMSAEHAAHGLASLLDSWRRGGMLHDEDEPIFGVWWNAGDRDITRGYVPFGFSERPPAAIRLAHEGEADQHLRTILSERGRTSAVDFIAKWGVTDPKEVAARAWELLRSLGVIVPVTLRSSKGNALRGSAGGYQVASAQIGLEQQNERYRCSDCRRVHSRPTPRAACTRIHCKGTLVREEPPADDYNLTLLRRPFAMVAAAEHTAQVPADRREEIEREFKRDGGKVNTIVATPTLELGVDIGALDMVLCRNVPPTPASYWQRVGRAGRRRRMAVIATYCRNAVHDSYFFERPTELLGAPIKPPRFNLRNDVLVRKHIHATVLSELLRLAADDDAMAKTLAEAIPDYIGSYLFEGDEGEYREAPAEVSGLAELIDTHRELLTEAIKRVFSSWWPSEAAREVSAERLEALVLEMPEQLSRFVRRLHERLLWVLETQRRLNEKAALRPLDEDEERQLERARDFIRGVASPSLRTYTLSVLAAEGFLPGYGLYEGGISAFPGSRGGLQSFELTRPKAIAVREFVPGNMLYANRGRFRTVRYQLPLSGEAQRLDPYRVVPEHGHIASTDAPPLGYSDSVPLDVDGLEICDAELGFLSPIRDDDEVRFQLPVTVLGMAPRHRRGGAAYAIDERPVHHLLGQALRLVNVGPGDRVRDGELGYPLCTVCGATRSPYASDAELDHFRKYHREECGREPGQVALSALQRADALLFQGLEDQPTAVNLGEALRIGASQVLEMEPEDVQVLPVGLANGGCDLYLYDPMPGGSGLLDQILEAWTTVVTATTALLRDCPGACETSCYSCLRTGRNVFWHRMLNRHEALEIVEGFASEPSVQHELQPLEDASLLATVETTTSSEDRLRELLDRAGLEGAEGQFEIEIGPPFDRTIPDFAWPEQKIAIYLDGLSKHIHGARERRRTDALIRGMVEDGGWTVIEIAASDLDDPVLLAASFRRIAKRLGQDEGAVDEIASGGWYAKPGEPSGATAGHGANSAIEILERSKAKPFESHIPLYSVRAAAGRFKENEEVVEDGWVEYPDRISDRLFAVRIEGVSMEPEIPNGSIAVFRSGPDGGVLTGSRQGKIVLAELHGATDPEGGGSFTVKRYESEKVASGGDGWEHKSISLRSRNPEVPDIKLKPGDDVAILAEFVCIL